MITVSIIFWQRVALLVAAVAVNAVALKRGSRTPRNAIIYLVVVGFLEALFSLMERKYESEMLVLATCSVIALEVIWHRERVRRGSFLQRAKERHRGWLGFLNPAIKARFEKELDDFEHRMEA
jgi:hypothetical protein